MTDVLTNTRSTIGLPIERLEQLRSLAKGRGVTPGALVELWIGEAVERGDAGAIDLPGYCAWRDDNVIVVEVAHRALPMMSAQQAMLLSAVLDGAAGTPNGPAKFNLPVGRAVPVDIGPNRIMIGRHGRGVVFGLSNEASETFERFAAPPSLVAEVARQIRRVVEGH